MVDSCVTSCVTTISGSHMTLQSVAWWTVVSPVVVQLCDPGHVALYTAIIIVVYCNVECIEGQLHKEMVLSRSFFRPFE